MPFKLRNFTVGEFNRDVNQSGDLQAKYESWNNYRKRVSALIGEAFTVNPQIRSALVLGAGNLNDLDLHDLCVRLNRLVLTDADLSGIERGIARQNLSAEERGKIDILQADYTGANDAGLFAGLERLAKRAASAAEIADYVKTAFAALAEADPAVFTEAYPLVISCPIYTQLLYTQVEVFLKILYEAGRYAYDDLNRILNAAYGTMPGILARYNDTVLSACDGLIVLLSDSVEIPKDGAVYQEAKRMQTNGFPDKREAEALIQEHGSELAQTGRADFTAKAEILRETYAVWPFDERKAYLVYGCLARRRG